MAEKINPIYFIDYDKIADTVMWFNSDYILKFNVILKHRNKNGDSMSFHSEYKTYNQRLDKEYLSISRSFTFYFTIESENNFGNGLVIRPNDVELLSMVIQNNIYPWFIGKNIFGTDKSGRRVIKGEFTPVQFPLTDQKFITFAPIVIDYENGQSSEGLRISINTNEEYFDITVNKFLEFAYYIIHTDMYAVACSMLNYVKTKPYLVNFRDYTEYNRYNNGDSGTSQNNFFRNI